MVKYSRFNSWYQKQKKLDLMLSRATPVFKNFLRVLPLLEVLKTVTTTSIPSRSTEKGTSARRQNQPRTFCLQQKGWFWGLLWCSFRTTTCRSASQTVTEAPSTGEDKGRPTEKAARNPRLIKQSLRGLTVKVPGTPLGTECSSVLHLDCPDD